MSTSPTIGLIGYGKMGKAIESVALKQNIHIGKILSIEDNQNGEGIRSLKNGEADVLIDFTVPQAVVSNVQAAAEKGINIVVGTTGWYDGLENVTSIVKKSGIGLIYASNFSIGMNILFQLVERTVQLIDKFPEYDVYLQEIHHNQKEDSPSGSALTIADIILAQSERKKRIETGSVQGKISPDQLHISSIRAGSVIGTHIAGFDSHFDSIEIKHAAKNRIGFVQGALSAAQWIHGKSGIFTMTDLLKI